jgi:cell division protein FtsA
MEIDKPYLFIEINEKNFIFFIAQYNQDLDFKILETKVVESSGILKGQIVDIEHSSKIIKDNLNILEKKISHTFKNVTIINDEDNFRCINVSGYKKLAGSQISNENISFILNNLKKLIINNNPNYSLVHLFNSGFVLDKVNLEKLPIGLYGEFYSHTLTFFLLSKNNIKNLKLVLNNCHIEIDRIVFRSFAKGFDVVKKFPQKDYIKLINIGKSKSQISIFYQSSFIYLEKFDFGTDIIMKDVSKLCSLNLNSVKEVFKNIDFNKFSGDRKEIYLEKKYFENQTYRKISLSHLYQIVFARVEELTNIIFKKNVNLRSFNNKKSQILKLVFDDENINNSCSEIFKKIFSTAEELEVLKTTQDEHLSSCKASAELIGKGWEKEAIPVIQAKKSIISRVFSTIFE